ncbi:MAG: DUF3048 C-terminal domain-containing protein [Clostridiales bacterium]|nr:DUF3048 C-terminal domain-containing protein [Clostridiales bacterium]MDY5513537.1 DUF3048 C-terminal domain-containing protein [Candidatus Ventricola sp.]
MKNLFRMLAAGLLCAALLLPVCASAADFSASGLTVSGTAQQLGAPQSYGGAKVTASLPGENSDLDGVNPITGEPFSGAYQPILVNIDAHPGALPHWGVSDADLTYEMPIQADGSTRELALFMGTVPDSAGPVRSARIPMCSLREMWGGVFYFYGYQGGSTSVLDWVKAHSANKKLAYPYINGITTNSGWFPRSNDSNHVAPHNVRLDLTAVRDSYTEMPTAHPFLFTDTGLEHGEAVDGIVISYKQTSPAYVTAYQYNAQTGLYERYRNGEPYVDANNGEACSYANVLVLRTDVSWYNGNNSRPVIRLNGEGVCEIFQNGRYIRGTWARDCTENSNLGSRMVFLDENGDELPLKVGRTFIQIVDNEQPVVVFSDSAIAGAVEPQQQRLTIGTALAAAATAKPKATRTPKPTATPEPTVEPTAEPTQTPTAVPEQPEETQQPEEKPEETQKPEEKPEETQKPEEKPEETQQPEKTTPPEQPDEGGNQDGSGSGDAASPDEAS